MAEKCYAPTGLTCEYMTNPIGIQSHVPRLAWKMVGNGKGRKQSAYQILAAHSVQRLKDRDKLCWDSGKIESSDSVGISYGGPEIQSRERIYWCVRIWDEAGYVSPWSDIHFWEAGLLNETDWQARWICGEEEVSAPYFRRDFFIKEKPEKARVYICGLRAWRLTQRQG